MAFIEVSGSFAITFARLNLLFDCPNLPSIQLRNLSSLLSLITTKFKSDKVFQVLIFIDLSYSFPVTYPQFLLIINSPNAILKYKIDAPISLEKLIPRSSLNSDKEVKPAINTQGFYGDNHPYKTVKFSGVVPGQSTFMCMPI